MSNSFNRLNLVPAGLAIMAVLISFGPAPALAHLWYPKECCNDQDCFRATSVVQLPDGSLRMTAGPIKVTVPPDFEKFPSQDNDAHVCVYSDLQGRYRPRCVFLPGIG